MTLHLVICLSKKHNMWTCSGIQQTQPREIRESHRFLNRLFASARVVVEQVIAGVKRCRIVKDSLRLTKKGVSDQVMEIACGLHNLRMACRHPLPVVDLLSLSNSP